MSASRKKRRRRRRRKLLRAIETMPLDETWLRVGPWCAAKRRSVWVRYVFADAFRWTGHEQLNRPDARRFLERIEVRGGREGDDFAFIVDRSNPAFDAFDDMLSLMRFCIDDALHAKRFHHDD